MYSQPLILLGEMDGETLGRIMGGLFAPLIILLYGVPKCLKISRRPGTNRKCALALMFSLLSLCGSYLSGVAIRLFGGSAHFQILNFLDFVIVITLAALALGVGIKGLWEYSRKSGLYNQGRAQAVWALTLSILMILIGFWNLMHGLKIRSAENNIKQVPGRPGRILEFSDCNFRFRAPEHPWVTVDLSGLNKDAKLSFMRQAPEAYFMIIPESLTTKMNSTQLAELGKAHVQSAASSFQIFRQTSLKVNNMDGILVEYEAQASKLTLYYEQWFMATNGYAYQLVAYGDIADRKLIENDARQMFSRFEVIDPNRIYAPTSAGFTTNYISPSHFYSVEVANSAWHGFPSLKTDFPNAEFGGSQGDSCFTVTPVWLGTNAVDIEALAAGFLSIMNIAYPDNDFTHRQVQNEAGVTGLQMDYKRTIDGTIYRYRLKIIHSGEFGYFVAAWTIRNEENADAILNDAQDRVRFSAPKVPPFTNQLLFGDQDLKNQAYILNQAGLFYFNQEDYENALPFFRAAISVTSTNTIYINNLLLGFCRAGHPQEGLDFINSQPQSILDSPDSLCYKAYFQSKCSLVEEATTNYCKLFSNGYRSDDDFKDYINLLISSRQFDRALSEVGTYLLAGDSLNIRLLKAAIYEGKGDDNQAVNILKTEHDNAPYNSKITRQLINTMLDAGMPNEALAYSKELVQDEKDSYLSYYLKARCEINLKWYRDAKVSLETAAKLEPSNDDVNSSLQYVSGLLGEGNNSMLKDSIDPVLLPVNLTNRANAIAGKEFALDSGAYYKQYYQAIHYDTNSEYKVSTYVLIHVQDASGVAAFSTYQMTFDPLSEDIYVNGAKVLDNSGNILTTIKSSDCYVIDDVGNDNVSQRKTLNIPIAGLQPGCDLSLVITRRSAGHQDEFPFLNHCFSKGYPVLISGTYLHGDVAGLKIRSTPGIQHETIGDGIYWSITNPMVDRSEPLQPPSDTYLPTLWIADGSGSWEGLARNYLASIKDRIQPDDNLRIKTLQLVDGLNDNSSKIAVLSRFVQTNCTYKAIEFGRHSRIPQKAADTLHNAYGDCKDHAVLLQQLLKYAGVPANLALISTYDPVQTDLPSLDQFNHMIVELSLEKGEKFIDTTDKGSDLSNNPPVGLAEKQALILNPAQPYFTKLSAYPIDASCINVKQHASLVASSDLKVEETITLTGVVGSYLRDYLQNIAPADRSGSMQRDMGLTSVVMTNCDIEELESPGRPLRITFTYVIKGRFHQIPTGLTGALYAGFERYYLITDPADNRSTPFELDSPLQIHSQVEFDMPKGYRVITKSDSQDKIDARFISYEATQQLQNGNLLMTFQFQRPTGRYNANDYPTYQELMEQVQSSMDHEIDLQTN
jgi:tetratricopeptide (TPR) repeat protein